MVITPSKPSRDPHREAQALSGAKILEELRQKYRADLPPRVGRPKLLRSSPSGSNRTRRQRKKMAAE